MSRINKNEGTHAMTVCNEDGDECGLLVSFETWYDPGVMYYPDGSGDPPDSGWEITGWKARWGQAPDWVTDELVEEVFEIDMESGVVN